MMVGMAKAEYTRNPLRYFGALASWPVLRALRTEMDPRAYNGASMVGLAGVVIKSHGSADAVSFRNAIRVAVDRSSERRADPDRESVEGATTADAAVVTYGDMLSAC